VPGTLGPPLCFFLNSDISLFLLPPPSPPFPHRRRRDGCTTRSGPLRFRFFLFLPSTKRSPPLPLLSSLMFLSIRPVLFFSLPPCTVGRGTGNRTTRELTLPPFSFPFSISLYLVLAYSFLRYLRLGKGFPNRPPISPKATKSPFLFLLIQNSSGTIPLEDLGPFPLILLIEPYWEASRFPLQRDEGALLS